MMIVVGAGAPGHGTHAVVPVGYDADTDKFLIVDSTGEFPADVVQLLYWCKFESMITPDWRSGIWTFDFGEVVSMTDVDNKLDSLLASVNSGFHSISGSVTIETDILPASGTRVEYEVVCPPNAKMFVFEANEDTLATIQAKTDANYTIGVIGNCGNAIEINARNGLCAVWQGKQRVVGQGGSIVNADNGIYFDCLPLIAGTYNWTAYYWND
jgi:hypothetical protein